MSKKIDLFLRHDNNDTDINDNLKTEGQTMFGMVWNVTKGLYIAPNVVMNDDVNEYHITCMFKY